MHHARGEPESKEALFRLLRRAGKAQKRAVLLEALGVWLSAALWVLLLGTVLAAFRVRQGSLAAFELASLLVASAGVLWWYGRRLKHTARSPIGIAHWLDQLVDHDRPPSKPRVRLQAAVELCEDRERENECATLRQEGLKQARHAAEVLDVLALARTSHKQHFQRVGAVLAASFIALSLAGYIAPNKLSKAWGALTATDELEATLVQLPPEPRLGDIRISYKYPSYSGRGPKTINSATGRIRALAGTEIVLETSARQSISRASLLISYGSEDDD